MSSSHQPAAVGIDPADRHPRRWSSRYARLMVRLRHVVVLAWIGLTAATFWLPSGGGGGGGIEGFVPEDSPAIATEIASVQEFGFPLLSRTVIVQHDPDGLSPYAQAQVALRALALTQGAYRDNEDLQLVLGALPLVNTFGIFPGSEQQGTTGLTYLFLPPWAGFGEQTEAARDFAEQFITHPDDDLIGVTGSVPARLEQGQLVEESLPLVETATVAAIVLIVALNFRSVVAPVIALGTAAVGFLITLRVAGAAGELFGISVPSDLQPLILALLLGVVTDYVIFFLSGAQHALRSGQPRLAAARTATAEFAPIVAVAGITVAAGTASLLVARSAFFRTFGPGMALTVLVALVVSVTLVPALLALLGRAAFWPAPPPRADEPEAIPGPGPSHIARRAFRGGRTIRLMTLRPVALLVALGCVAGLVLAAVPLRDLRLGLGFVPSLPSSNEASVAAAAAKEGFADGILSPTVLLLQEDGIVADRAALGQLERLIEDQPGVAGVLGPDDPITAAELGIVLADSGDAARYLVIMDDEPLGAAAIETLQDLERRLPGLVEEAGLAGVETGLAGDTALASALVQSTQADLGRIATAALLVNLLMLVLFLRALVAPLYLLACSVLALCASLGLTTFLFQDVLGHDGITFYVPFAAAVLLVALGSDYNIFGVGHIWGVARTLPLRQAIIEAVPRTTRAITAAGITLAASFGMLALVPLRPFRELAFVMAVGILLDAVVVRSFLVPTLLSLFGRFSWWPGRARRNRSRPESATPAAG